MRIRWTESPDFGPKSDLSILKSDFIPSDFAISDCVRRPIHSSDRKVKIRSSKPDRVRMSLILTSQCGGTGLMSYRSYRPVRYRVTFYRTFQSVRYRYPCCADTGTNSSTDVHTGTGGTGIDFVPNLPKCPVPVLMSYRTYQRVRYRYCCRTELTEVSDTGSTGGIYWRYASARTVPYTPLLNCIHSIKHKHVDWLLMLDT